MQIKWKPYPRGGVCWASAFSPEAKRVTFAWARLSLSHVHLCTHTP
ncbi:uncharacterized protein PpBr36_09891 [Pyricularia pennisetigena]|nr:uncharacterized protein PpBr36_09891 [Pyricularia pennisetigena]TLS22548.1 hypothetical protein PpBr36_09891 [Pyricularia pennisetigena]